MLLQVKREPDPRDDPAGDRAGQPPPLQLVEYEREDPEQKQADQCQQTAQAKQVHRPAQKKELLLALVRVDLVERNIIMEMVPFLGRVHDRLVALEGKNPFV